VIEVTLRPDLKVIGLAPLERMEREGVVDKYC